MQYNERETCKHSCKDSIALCYFNAYVVNNRREKTDVW